MIPSTSLRGYKQVGVSLPLSFSFPSQELTSHRSANDVMTYVSPSTRESIAAFIFFLSGKSPIPRSHH
jgi:hypothetical protein